MAQVFMNKGILVVACGSGWHARILSVQISGCCLTLTD